MFSKHVLFKQGFLNKRAGVWTPWTPPGSATATFRRAHFVRCPSHFAALIRNMKCILYDGHKRNLNTFYHAPENDDKVWLSGPRG